MIGSLRCCQAFCVVMYATVCHVRCVTVRLGAGTVGARVRSTASSSDIERPVLQTAVTTRPASPRSDANGRPTASRSSKVLSRTRCTPWRCSPGAVLIGADIRQTFSGHEHQLDRVTVPLPEDTKAFLDILQWQPMGDQVAAADFALGCQ
jgi:hypothetical protein